jgi:NitT/TauT family transport system substrate-binding protein
MRDPVCRRVKGACIVRAAIQLQRGRRRMTPSIVKPAGFQKATYVSKITMVACLFLVVLSWSAVVGGAPAPPPLKKVSLIPQWLPQAQFAGYMVALKKGFYREAGLDVEMLSGGPGKPALDILASGEATFCTDWLANGIAKRAAGLKVVNLAQIIQRSALILLARKKSGIQRPKDLDGKTVGLWEKQFYLQPILFFRKFGVSVNIVRNYSSVALFLEGAVDATSAMWYNEYHEIVNSGFDPEDLTLFFFSDVGLNFPEDGIYCLEDTFTADPEMCRAFVEASLKGWRHAFEHPDEALAIVMKYATDAHTRTNRVHQRWMLNRMKDLIIPHGDLTGFGKLDVADFTRVRDTLKEFGLIEDLPRFEDFYRGAP